MLTAGTQAWASALSDKSIFVQGTIRSNALAQITRPVIGQFCCQMISNSRNDVPWETRRSEYIVAHRGTDSTGKFYDSVTCE